MTSFSWRRSTAFPTNNIISFYPLLLLSLVEKIKCLAFTSLTGTTLRWSCRADVT